jgi:hypothetical protein
MRVGVRKRPSEATQHAGTDRAQFRAMPLREESYARNAELVA